MKISKMIFPLVITLAAMLATTGCKHGFNKVTPLPGERPAPVGDNNGLNTVPPGNALPDNGGTPITNVGPNTPPGGGGTSDINLDNYNQDRAALAAYTVHFKFDSAVVQDAEQANIASVGQALSDPSLKLLIEGNCDERGTDQYNLSLGERRALALREALAKNGIDPLRIKTISYGKEKPADPGHDEAAWAKNRRGEFVLLHPK
jgi:peptidoglycan-associated lipoprotein